ncbi:unnamed protein product [Lactuca virosa]|uniref:Uncharacterized protein n=1 Tax=Lactuca virosa TaxID=75947 RepID=A0AAU9MKT2_9ASTR|nr:unnamed protein product [Lactuca virosa]
MPRTTTVESAGCPPLRALTFDVLGLIKVTEARSKLGGVLRWSRDGLLAVARKSGVIELISSINGDLRVSLPSGNQLMSSLKKIILLGCICSKNKHLNHHPPGHAPCLHAQQRAFNPEIFNTTKITRDSTSDDDQVTWNVCAAGNVLCCKVDDNENYALFGGKGVEVNIWDLATHTKIWTAKSPPKNSLGIFTPTWFTSATFLCKDDHRKFVGGTNSHQVRLYDMAAQRRPGCHLIFVRHQLRQSLKIKMAIQFTLGMDLVILHLETLGLLLGKCSGSIRSIARHPDLPVIASCGLDSYLRIWDIKSRQLLSAVFLKQHLTNVVFDSHFNDEG